jgi:hypothetical protein
MKNLLLVTGIAVVILVSACEKFIDRITSILTVENNSNDSVVCFLSFDYPSMILPDWQKSTGYFWRNIPPNQKAQDGLTHGAYIDVIRKNSRDTLIVFFIKIDTLRKYGYNQNGFDVIRQDNNILGYKFFTKKNINGAGNGYIAYP